jgi:dGTPase
MTIREQYEKLEQLILSPKAVLSSNTKGRLVDEEPCKVRTAFQRDRDRIIHSKSFRRLKHKTQVFIDPEEDHYRTRLTHTLEVAQIARTIARALRLNEDLTEAIALGHDLGHTPFGHAGEAILDEMAKEYIPNARFTHSKQSLRVVDILEKDGKGLNLTWEVRDGIIHHSKGSADLSLDTKGPSTLEGKIVKISDRVAYINHDIDDAIRAGIITEKDLPKEAVMVLGNSHSQRIGTMVLDIINCGLSINMSKPVRCATDSLKDFMYSFVYGKEIGGMKELEDAGNKLRKLFRFYMNNPSEISEHIGYVDRDMTDLGIKVQAVCDFMSGMTDRYAQTDYEKRFKNA